MAGFAEQQQGSMFHVGQLGRYLNNHLQQLPQIQRGTEHGANFQQPIEMVVADGVGFGHGGIECRDRDRGICGWLVY